MNFGNQDFHFYQKSLIFVKILKNKKMEVQTATLETLQAHLVSRVQATRDIDKLVRFLIFLDELPISEASAQRIFRPVGRGVTLEKLKREQNFKGTDWRKFNELTKALDIQEPIDVLISQLSK